MKDTIETISLVEGMPRDAPPSQIILATRIRKEKSRQERIELAVGISNLILGGLSGKGDATTALRHMFTDKEYKDLLEQQNDRKELANQMQQLAKLKGMRKR